MDSGPPNEGKRYLINKTRINGAKAKYQDNILKRIKKIVVQKPAKVNFASLICEPDKECVAPSKSVVSKNQSSSSSNYSWTREGTVTREIFQNIGNKIVDRETNSSLHNNFPISDSSVERLALTPLSHKPEIVTLSSDGSKNSSPPLINITPKNQNCAPGCSKSHNFTFSPEISSTSRQPISTSGSTESSETVDLPTLNDTGKQCLEAVPIIFNQYFGIPMDTCFTTLVKNNYNILTTILELQNEASLPEDTIYDDSISS